MSRTNYFLLIGVIVLLVAAVVGGQLEFRRTHPGGAPDLAQAPGDGIGEAARQPAASPEAPAGAAGTTDFNVAELDQGPGPNDGKPFPAEVNGLPRTAHSTGAAALAEISKLHGKEIPAASAEIATYGSGQEKVIVWMTASATKEEAQELFRKMLERMEANPTTYTRPEPLSIRGKVYFSTRGNGMNHYFYLRGARIYWAALQIPMDKVMGVMSFIVNQL
ncbi:MAG: hypothetical protein QME79_07350 [Bacillota bacterium]|nr:hypothetical protein [Bacillota bacterium]